MVKVSLNTRVLKAFTMQGGFSSPQAQQVPICFCKGQVEAQRAELGAEPVLHKQLIPHIVRSCACTNRQNETIYMESQTSTLHTEGGLELNGL